MATPSLQNGYLRISNELFDAISRYKASRIQKDILFTVIRFTDGFNKDSAVIPLSKISKYLGESEQSVSAALNKLIEFNVILVNKNFSSHNGREIRLNKNYESWKIPDSILKGFGKNRKRETQNNMNPETQNNVNLNTDLTQNNMNSETQNSMNTCKDNIFKNNFIKDKLNTVHASKINYSISHLPKNLNGQTFYIGKFFWIDKSLIKELRESIPGINSSSDHDLLNEFDRMTNWLEKNGPKKDYKSFVSRWLKKQTKNGNEQKLLELFQELFFQNRNIEYEITNKKRDLFYIKKLMEMYSFKHPANSIDKMVEDFSSFFSACLNITEKWFWRNMSPSLIVNKFNEIKMALKNPNQNNNHSGASAEDILNAIAKNFIPEYK